MQDYENSFSNLLKHKFSLRNVFVGVSKGVLLALEKEVIFGNCTYLKSRSKKFMKNIMNKVIL